MSKDVVRVMYEPDALSAREVVNVEVFRKLEQEVKRLQSDKIAAVEAEREAIETYVRRTLIEAPGRAAPAILRFIRSRSELEKHQPLAMSAGACDCSHDESEHSGACLVCCCPIFVPNLTGSGFLSYTLRRDQSRVTPFERTNFYKAMQAHFQNHDDARNESLMASLHRDSAPKPESVLEGPKVSDADSTAMELEAVRGFARMRAARTCEACEQGLEPRFEAVRTDRPEHKLWMHGEGFFRKPCHDQETWDALASLEREIGGAS